MTVCAHLGSTQSPVTALPLPSGTLAPDSGWPSLHLLVCSYSASPSLRGRGWVGKTRGKCPAHTRPTFLLVVCLAGGLGVGCCVPHHSSCGRPHTQALWAGRQPDLDSSGQCGLAYLKVGDKGCLFSFFIEATRATAFHRFRSTCPWFQRGQLALPSQWGWGATLLRVDSWLSADLQGLCYLGDKAHSAVDPGGPGSGCQWFPCSPFKLCSASSEKHPRNISALSSPTLAFSRGSCLPWGGAGLWASDSVSHF